MSVLLDEETVVLEGLDFEVPCGVTIPTEHAADRAIRHHCCGVMTFGCEEHIANALEYLRDVLSYFGFLTCRRCKAVHPSIEAALGVIPL